MALGVLAVAKRRKENFDRERLELRAPANWIARVTKEAERLGLSLSAYIRLAVNERLDRTEGGRRSLRRNDSDK